MTEPYSYDIVPYPSLTFPKTSPERLATQAAVNGMIVADPRECSYLELGCGDGTNLLAHAYMYPESRFLGIDLSRNHIDIANASVSELGIKNTTFRQMDLMDLDESALDKFDFIVAHGLFSWVPKAVRTRVLDIYSKHLATEGVGYISYNTYPGCHIREVVREIMQYLTRSIDDPMEKVGSGISFVKMIGELTDKDSTYRSMIEEEYNGMIDRSPENILHDDLSENNQPFYFYEFAEMLVGIGMQYLTEAEDRKMQFETLSDATAKMLAEASSNLIEREQCLDFIRCRRFRSTLFCREEIALDRERLRSHVKEFYFAGRLRSKAEPSTVRTEEPETFFGPTTEKITCNHPLTKASVRYLSGQWTRSVRFDELIENSIEMFEIPARFRSEDDVSRTRDFFIELFRVGLFRLHRLPSQGVTKLSAKPRVSRFARWQIERGSSGVMTLTGLSLEPDDDATRQLLTLADGTRDVADLVRFMIENFESRQADQPLTKEDIENMVKTNLESFVKNGLLEA